YVSSGASAMLTLVVDADSVGDLLDRSKLLDNVAKDANHQLQALTDAKVAADAARRRAGDAERRGGAEKAGGGAPGAPRRAGGRGAGGGRREGAEARPGRRAGRRPGRPGRRPAGHGAPDRLPPVPPGVAGEPLDPAHPPDQGRGGGAPPGGR